MNKDYHVVHHHEPTVHWAGIPEFFERNLDMYVACRATVFGDCQQGMLSMTFIFGKRWSFLTDHFIVVAGSSPWKCQEQELVEACHQRNQDSELRNCGKPVVNIDDIPNHRLGSSPPWSLTIQRLLTLFAQPFVFCNCSPFISVQLHGAIEV